MLGYFLSEGFDCQHVGAFFIWRVWLSACWGIFYLKGLTVSMLGYFLSEGFDCQHVGVFFIWRVWLSACWGIFYLKLWFDCQHVRGIFYIWRVWLSACWGIFLSGLDSAFWGEGLDYQHVRIFFYLKGLTISMSVWLLYFFYLKGLTISILGYLSEGLNFFVFVFLSEGLDYQHVRFFFYLKGLTISMSMFFCCCYCFFIWRAWLLAFWGICLKGSTISILFLFFYLKGLTISILGHFYLKAWLSAFCGIFIWKLDYQHFAVFFFYLKGLTISRANKQWKDG